MVVLSAPFSQVSGAPVAVSGWRTQSITGGSGVNATRADVREHLAFDLYSASFFQPSADARFLMLMMALETLLDPQPRPQSVQDHVTQLLDWTKGAALPEAERASIT